jgi:ribonucleoside-diphosphate reductase alpha chain
MIEKIKGKEHLVIKRDGRHEKYSKAKLTKAINRLTNNNEHLTNEIIESMNLKIYNKIKIEKLWDEVIETIANKITEMYPIWNSIAAKAYLAKIYKETYNLTSEISTLEYADVLRKGVTAGVYSREIVESFTEEEISELGSYIKKERDLDFTFIGLVNTMEKYAFNASVTSYICIL